MLNITNTLLTKLTIGLLFLSSQLALWAAEPAPSAEWAAVQVECAQQYAAFKARQITAAHDRILLTAENCPTFYQALTKLAARVGVSLPPEVWLICVAPQSCNAGVYRTIIDRYHTKLQLALGYELIKICNEREFIALMAHEFGHLKLGHLECGLGDQLLLQQRVTPLATINYLIALIAQNHSRQDEFAADLIAYQVTNDAASIHSMLTKLAQAYEQHLPGYKAIMRHQHLLRVSSHPTDADRYAALQKLHQQRRYQTQPANKLTLATL